MKKHSILIWLLSIVINGYSQYFDDEARLFGDIIEEVPDMIISLNDTRFSGNGNSFTPQGDMRILVICVGFGEPYDSAFPVGHWDAAPGALPQNLLDKSTFYSDASDFVTYANANHTQNVSRFFYEMSNHRLRIMADVYPSRINIDASGANSFRILNGRALEKMKLLNPSFDWTPYDNRTNQPQYIIDNSISSADMKPDYIIFCYRYSGSMPLKPVPDMNEWTGAGGGYATANGIDHITYNGYHFDNCGFTAGTGIGNIYTLFIREMVHNLYDCPHYAHANDLVGDYFYARHGWGAMGSTSGIISRNCMLGWEKWYLNWIESIQSNGVDSEINSAADLNPAGQYILRDFLTTGDVVRIKLPNANGERNQYLWLENHQNISVFANFNSRTVSAS